MATELKPDAINGDKMATEFAFGDAEYDYGSIPSPSYRHMGDGYEMAKERTRSHLMYFL